MSQDTISDGLNQIMNCKRAGKDNVVIIRYSKVLINVLEIAKKQGYLDYQLDEKNKVLRVKIKSLNEGRAIKPRFYVKVEEIEKYVRRYLPSREFGIILISTSKGLITQAEAYEKNIGGSLVAYFY
ncbi:30S ribosomal protein S8 [Candidatus Pacearchaeota archaeon]|nr:30S ribosomal protein S8 [Candidatus Pacearchaeota archaeon]